jgi:4-amino-4-deoxy-L-arabinose transferase-like glycosyltransferase
MVRWPKSWSIRVSILIVAIHAILLFAVIPQISSSLTPTYNQDRFIDGYDQLAANLAQGNGYRFFPDTARTLMREPGYPLLLAGILLVFGPSFTAVKVMNMLLALAVAWLMTRIAWRFSSRPWLTILPPLLFLFHPGTLIAESRGGVEILFAFLIALFVLALYRALENNRGWDYAAAGAVLGVTVLVRSTPLLFPVFLLGYLLVFEGRRIPRLVICRNIAVLILVMFAVVSPWIIRNYAITGRFVPTASVLGVSVHAGEYICEHRSEGRPWFMLDHEAAMERGKLATQLGYPFKGGYYQVFYNSEDELKFSKFLFQRVVSEYQQSPLLCVKCVTYNLFNFWFAGKTWKSTLLNLAVQLPYMILAVAGAVLCVKNHQFKVLAPLVLFMLYVIAVYIPILAQARYSVPLLPFMSILASMALLAVRKDNQTMEAQQ